MAPMWRNAVDGVLRRLTGQDEAPTRSANSRRAKLPELVLHIGSGKTGTSSIQGFLAKNRERLAELGILYPRAPGRTRHVRLSLSLRSDADLVMQPGWSRQGYSSPARFREDVDRQLREELREAALPRVLLSDEALYGASEEKLERLRAMLARMARRPRVVVYLRRQDDHLCSRYQTVIQRGDVRRLTERLEQMSNATMYDYDATLRTWQRLVEPTEIIVRPFDRGRFVGGSLLRDFLNAADINAAVDDFEEVGVRNESLDAESVEFLRILNLYRVEHEGARAGLIDNRSLLTRLGRASTGPTLTLGSEALDAFMARWEQSNQRVAREFLKDGSDRLFDLPRKTRDTTVEQRLDPARVEHFVSLLELPEPMHSPLRALAEREAKDG